MRLFARERRQPFCQNMQLLIGILVNGMTIMDLEDTRQNLIKAFILLAVVIADTLLNQRNEQTERQGDI